eukprot:2435298-Pleurochrysis_carterae.AAC.3
MCISKNTPASSKAWALRAGRCEMRPSRSAQGLPPFIRQTRATLSGLPSFGLHAFQLLSRSAEDAVSA